MICCSHFAVVLKQIHKSLVLEIWYSRTRFFTTLHISDDCHERSVITCFQQHQPKLISKLFAAVTVTCMVLWYWSTIVSPKISTIQDLTETTWIKGKYVLEYVSCPQTMVLRDDLYLWTAVLGQWGMNVNNCKTNRIDLEWELLQNTDCVLEYDVCMTIMQLSEAVTIFCWKN